MSLTSYRAAPPRVTCFAQRSGLEPDAVVRTALLARFAIVVPLGFGPGGLFRLCGAELVLSCRVSVDDLCGPGGDRLSRVLRHSTIGAETFDGRVRDGIGSCRLADATRPAKIIVGRRFPWEDGALFGSVGSLVRRCARCWSEFAKAKALCL